MDPQTLPSQPPNANGQPDYSKPVAYDQQGNPLYAHPPADVQQSAHGQPQMVYLARPLEPHRPQIPEEVQRRAEESQRQYPHLNLSEGEYIVTAVRRHPIGLIQIWGAVLLVIGIFFAAFAALFMNPESSPLAEMLGGGEDVTTMGAVLVGGLSMLAILGGLAATYIYNNNRFYLTNESVIQEIQNSLFSKHEQTVNLSNIEDASYQQNNILQMMLNYGSIRLSTEGDETTYRFSYVANPKKHIATLNNAVESFKSGRPVHPA